MKFFHSDSSSTYSVSLLVAALFFVISAQGATTSGDVAETNDIPPAEGEDGRSQLSVCIDDSDCKKLGQGNLFACFMVRASIRWL